MPPIAPALDAARAPVPAAVRSAWADAPAWQRYLCRACGLVYELAAGALASYLLGDSVLQFSTIIGTYLFAMGVGSWLSRYFDRQLPAHFLRKVIPFTVQINWISHASQV